MELLLLVAIFAAWSFFWGAGALLIGFALGLAYGRSYWDGSERDGSRAWPAFRHHAAWTLVRRGVELYLGGFDAGEGPRVAKGTLFAVAPHGLWPISIFLAVCVPGRNGMPPWAVARAGRGTYLAVTRVLFWIPGIRDLALWCGCVDAREGVMRRLLREDKNVFLYPGGVREGILVESNLLNVCEEHAGFQRLAMATGAPLVPVLAQGENELFRVLPWFRERRRQVARLFGYPFPSIFWPVPRRVPLALRVGAPLADPRRFYPDGLWPLIAAHVDPARIHPDLNERLKKIE